MNLDVYNTHMELYPYTLGDLPIIESMYTSIEKFGGTEKPCGYIIDNGKLFLPRGTPISKIESLCNIKANYITESDEYEMMSKTYHPLYDPRNDLQEKSINFLKEDEHQLSLNLLMGLGKTYCTTKAITDMQMKSIIICPSENIKSQWILKTFKNMFGFRPKDICNIAGSNIIEGIMEDEIEPFDSYFVNHQTLQSYMSTNGGYALHKFFKKIKVGVKVYDESHLHFKNILNIDFFSNTYKTIYLSATFDRSDKTESACFKKAFASVVNFGENESFEEITKHVIYHIVNINSRITPKDRKDLIGYAGLTGASYGKYAFLKDLNKTAYNVLLKILKLVENVEGKILIFIPLIDAVEEVAKELRKDQDKSVGVYHSKVSKDEKENTLNKKDIIVSTVNSLGTGQDIDELRVVINFEPIASKVLAKQMFGRIRPYKDKKTGELKDTYFFDIVDICIGPANWYWRARYKIIQTLYKKEIFLNINN